MSFVSNIVGGILGANAAGNAASVESQAAQQAQKVSQQNQTAANQAQQTALSNVTSAEQPYQTLGSTAENHLSTLLSNGFTAPTLQQAEQTPGYQFNLQQGTQAIDENAAANGTLMTGNTGTALENYGQGLAQNAYQQTYNNALSQYQTNVAGLQGAVNTGLTSTGQLSSANLGIAGNTANIDLTAAQQQMQQINNAAAARAQGILGTAAGYGQMAGGLINGATSVFGGLGNLSTDSSFGENVGNFFSGMNGGTTGPAPQNAYSSYASPDVNLGNTNW
jgi:ElaB/YqjD/DUF883 family membrane-anchored ribosome-binding protein